MANGAKELLDEVATGKVTGEEERYSHTDLVDFKANVEGAEKSYELLKPVAAKNDPALAKELDKQFAALNTLLDKYREDKARTSFTSYDKVGKAERKELVGRRQRARRAAVQARRRRRRSRRVTARRRNDDETTNAPRRRHRRR